MHFGFALELSNVDLLNIDLLDTHLDLLDTDIPSKYFAFLNNVLKMSSRHVFNTSSRHVLKTSSRNVFKTSSSHVFKTSSRRLQRSNFSSSKMSSKRLQGMSWRRVQDVFKTNKCLLGCYHILVLKMSKVIKIYLVSFLISASQTLPLKKQIYEFRALLIIFLLVKNFVRQINTPWSRLLT